MLYYTQVRHAGIAMMATTQKTNNKNIKTFNFHYPASTEN